MRVRQLHAGSSVQFRLGDAVCPEFGQVTTQMSPDVTVCGEVVFFSDCGTLQNHFAIIAVGGMDTPMVVPTDRLTQSAPTPAAPPALDADSRMESDQAHLGTITDDAPGETGIER